MTEAEKNWREHTGLSCARIQDLWGTCTNPRDQRYASQNANCPTTCAKARGECDIVKEAEVGEPGSNMNTDARYGDSTDARYSRNYMSRSGHAESKVGEPSSNMNTNARYGDSTDARYS